MKAKRIMSALLSLTLVAMIIVPALAINNTDIEETFTLPKELTMQSAVSTAEEEEHQELVEDEDVNVAAFAAPTLRSGGTSGDIARVAEFYVSRIQDGTAPFDSSEDPEDPYYKDRIGNDENAANQTVRSFDTVTYDLYYRLAPHVSTDNAKQATMEFEFLLPLDTNEAEWAVESMGWIEVGSATVEFGERTYAFDGENVERRFCQILKGKVILSGTEENPNAIPSTGTLDSIINVWGMANESEVQPVFTVWLEGDKAGDTLLWDMEATGNEISCNTEHDLIRQATFMPEPVKVTAEPRYNVQIRQSSDTYYVQDIYDFDTGNDLAIDRGEGKVNGMTTMYGITLQLYNHENRGLKGIELPKGDITFDVEIMTTFEAARDESLSAQQKEYVEKSYAPLVFSYDEHRIWGGQQDGRDLGENETYVVHTAPGNRGMVSASSEGSVNAHNGGTWRAQRDTTNTNAISFTVSDYEIDPRLFPNANLGNASNADIYFNPASGIAHIGSFSAGELFVVTPFYNNGKVDPAKRGSYVLDDLGVEDGDFYTTLTGGNLRATSISGQDLPRVDDNSNQANTGDDGTGATIYLARNGEFDWRVAWSSYSHDMWDWAFRDVLGRTDSGDDWVSNGLDTLTPGVNVGIGLGFHNIEDGFIANRAVAANVLNKFDADAVTLTGNTREVGIDNFGLEYQILYGVKPDGMNWIDDDEMNNAEIEDLIYYDSIEQIPAGSKCVAVLGEIRPSGNATEVKKFNTGGIMMIQVEGIVSMDPSAVGKVFPMVIGGEIWRLHDYIIGGEEIEIPSMLGHTLEDPISVPDSTIKDYREYVKVTYQENGEIIGHRGDQNFGDSLRIVDVTSRITKGIAQKEADGENKRIYQMDNDQRYADFVLTPSFNEMPEGVTKVTTVTIVDTLPPNLRYVSGSSYIGGTYEQNVQSGRPGSVIGGEAVEPNVGTTIVAGEERITLTWRFINVSTDDPLPRIHFTTEIGIKGDDENDVNNLEFLTNEVVISTTGDLRPFAESTGNKASVALQISKLSSTSLAKLSDLWYDIYDYMDYRLIVGNNADVRVDDTVILDTMPMDGDEKGNNFTGSIYIRKFQLDATHMSNIGEWKCYYTTSPAAKDTISDDYNANDIRSGTSILPEGTVTWIPATLDGALNVVDIIGMPDVTGIAFVGDLLGRNVFRANIELHAPESNANEIFVNGLSRGREVSHALTRVVDRRISGLAWLDVNEDGIRSGSDEVIISGIKIQLLKKNAEGDYEPFLDKDGNPVFTETSTTENSDSFQVWATNNKGEDVLVNVIATAREDGSYLFSGVPVGTYGIRFESGSTSLAAYTASPVRAGTEPYIDSDGEPTYEDEVLIYTQIKDIEMPKVEDMLSGVYISEFNDSGFYHDGGSITLIKKDDKGNFLQGVEFSLEKKDQNGDWQRMITATNITDVNGKLFYNTLLLGEYRITEVSTVDGHTLLAEPIIVTLPYVADIGTPGMREPDYTMDGKGYYLHLTYTIENGQSYMTPSAGGSGGSIYFIAGGLLVAFAVNLWLVQKRKQLQPLTVSKETKNIYKQKEKRRKR